MTLPGEGRRTVARLARMFRTARQGLATRGGRFLRVRAGRIAALVGDVRSDPRALIPRRIAPKVDLSTVGAAAESPGFSDCFIRPDYESRPQPGYFLDEEKARLWPRTWQPDVYSQARQVARELGARRIVDIGCGSGEKLAGFHPEFDVVGVDFGRNITRCKERYDFGDWVAHDLERDGLLRMPVETFHDAVIICADVIEHVKDPHGLLRELHRVHADARALIVSTPDRERLRGRSHRGPSPNVHHVREWSLPEFAALLKAHGFTRGTVGFTRSHNRTVFRTTIIAVIQPAPSERAVVSG